ncbi:MAG: hypothetical protein QGH15_03775 [Kiritimatiellia bacterium]|jgi:hypothetical protein|nr:hypothetical protein [Kiritimatiellia bacterium]
MKKSIIITRNRTNIVMALVAVAMATLVLAATSANADVLLETGFDGTSNDGSTLSNITYTTENSLTGPSSLSGASQSPTHSLFTTPNATGHYAPSVNINNGEWNVDIPLTVTGAAVQISDVILGRQHFNGSGNFNGTYLNRSYPIIVTLSGASAGQVGQVTLDPGAGDWGGPAGVETFSFGTPVTLTSSDTWTLNLQVGDGGGIGGGIFVGFDGFAVQGTVVDPATSGTLIYGK